MANHDSETCGYQPTSGLDTGQFTTDQCNRPIWEDHDRCIWHAPVNGKTKETLEEGGPESEESIAEAHLREASISDVDWFAGMSLVGANLTGANLQASDLSETDLTMATLTDVSAIGADFTGANLEGAIFTNADLRRATLENARLHGTILTDIHVGTGTTMGDVSVYDRENAPPDLVDEQPLEAAAWVYRQLQTVYRKNSLDQLARESYYRERDTRRRLAWTRSNYVEAIKWELSRWVMRYGSSPYRILLTSLVVIVVGTLVFPLTGGIQETQGGQTITYSIDNPEEAPRWWIVQVLFKSLYFSVVTFATLGYGDIQPIGTIARLLAGAEAILGALLAALLVFVLARIVTW